MGKKCTQQQTQNGSHRNKYVHAYEKKKENSTKAVTRLSYFTEMTPISFTSYMELTENFI